jgi:hypothetical protein
MEFLDSRIAVLQRTPAVLSALLADLPETLFRVSEGGETWSPYDVVGHLIHGEKTDWIPRLRIILEHGESRAFEPFDRFAQMKDSQGASLAELLAEFADSRAGSLNALRAHRLEEADLARTGLHPKLGAVTLGELLTAWAVHDLDHLAQVARAMAKRFGDEVGPWRAYLRILE